jgi:hypothetical protein
VTFYAFLSSEAESPSGRETPGFRRLYRVWGVILGIMLMLSGTSLTRWAGSATIGIAILVDVWRVSANGKMLKSWLGRIVIYSIFMVGMGIWMYSFSPLLLAAWVPVVGLCIAYVQYRYYKWRPAASD